MSSDANESLTLRVAKAIPSDVATEEPESFDNDLNLNPETSSRLKEKKTAAIVWRCRPEDAGVIRIDGIIRKTLELASEIEPRFAKSMSSPAPNWS